MAGIETTVATSITAPRRSLYTWLVPGVFYNELDTILQDAAGLPGVARTSNTTGPWDAPGSSRTVHLTDGNTAQEQVTAADTPDYFAYVVTGFSHPLVRMLVKEGRGQWWFTDEPSGTHVKWTYAFVPRSALAAPLLMPVVKFSWNRSMKAALANIKRRAETELKGAPR
jgi:hypothetical protein